MVNYSNKGVFWQALIFTIVIFGIGMIFGYFLESSRADKVTSSLMDSEINLLDEQLRGEVISASNISCELAVKSTFAFADKIYNEAYKLEEYEASSKFNRQTLTKLHKRYDVLRMQLWLEGIKLKDRCGGFQTVAYFFDYGTDDLNVKSKQTFFSRLLTDVKNAEPEKVLLIPIAGNLDIVSIDLQMEQYNVTALPTILVGEGKIVTDIITLEEAKKMIYPAQNNSEKSFA